MKKKVLGLLLAIFGICSVMTSCKKQEEEATIVQHEVSFYAEKDDVVAISTVKVNDGEKVSKPSENPTKSSDAQYDYTFENWYDFDTEELYDFDAPVKKDLAIYADYNKTPKEVEPYTLVAYFGSQLAPYANSIKAEYEKVKDTKCTVTWVFDEVSNTGASVGAAVLDYDEANASAKVQLLVAHKYVWMSGSEDKPNLYGEIAGYWKYAVDAHKPDASWISNKKTTFNCNVVSSVDALQLAECTKIITILEAANPDYFDCDTVASLKTTGETTKQLSPLAFDGTTAATGVTYESTDVNVATVSEAGLITAVAVGTCTIKATKGSYTIEVAVDVSDVDYDLIVYIAGHNKHKISETEANAIIASFQAEGKAGKGKLIKMDFSEVDDGTFATNATSGNADVVIGSTNISNIALDSTYGKTHLGEGWVADTSRYCGVTAACAEGHKALAVELFNMVTGNKEGYISASVENTTITVGQTEQISIVGTSTITYSSSDVNVASVSETGLITAVAAGTATITVTGLNNSKTIEITVNPATGYGITVYLSSKYSSSLNTLKATYNASESKDSNCIVTWVVSTNYKQADVAADVIAYDEANTDAKCNMVVGHNQMWSNTSASHANLYNGGSNPTEYWEEIGTSGCINAAWGAENNNYGITLATTGDALAQCQLIASILCAEMPAA